MASSVESFILRFRDLSTSPGQTVEKHSEIVQRQGCVYWGWWAKSGEAVPVATFAHLYGRLKQGQPFKCYLFDSGVTEGESLYEVQCGDIDWQKDLAPAPSPQPDATPAYYSDRACQAWFKFSSVPEKIDSSLLRGWSYVDVDEFFQSGESPYGSFEGKQVSSTRELQQQNRTIWFIRPFDEAKDETHEILLTDPKRLDPEDFSRQYRTATGDCLLWLSDLHFSIDGHHGFPLQPSASRRPLARAIENALEESHLKDRIGGVLVSGDLTWKAHQQEYQQAGDCLEDLLHGLGPGIDGQGLSDFDLLVCPGNHDLPFSEKPQDDGQEVQSVIADPEVTEGYRTFYRRFFNKSPNQFLCSGRKILLGGAVPVEIAALNSSFLEQKKWLFQGHGFVGREQLDYVAEQMGWSGAPQDSMPVRILMLHHHLLPVTYRDIGTVGGNYSVALDAEAVMRWMVDKRIRIVLHGHMHQPFCVKLSRFPQKGSSINMGGDMHEVWVLGAGSAGVEAGHLGEIQKNVFGVLRYQTSAVECLLFSVHSVNQSENIWKMRLPL